MKISLKKIAGIAMILAAGGSCFAAKKWNSKKAINVLSREEGSGTRGFQGGLTWYHAKLGILKSLQKLKERNLVNTDLLC